MAEVKWIKIATDIFDDEKILLIESMPDADALIVIWLKILVLAGKCNNDGVLTMGVIPYTDEMLAAIFRRPLNTVRLALATFERFGMIEIINDVITLPKWEKHQALEGMDKIREQTKERVRRHREKQKQLVTQSNVTGNARITHSNGTDKDIDKELDIENSCSYTDVWRSLTADEMDSLYATYEDAGELVQQVYEDVKLKRKKIDNPYNYIIGYAQNRGWKRL